MVAERGELSFSWLQEGRLEGRRDQNLVLGPASSLPLELKLEVWEEAPLAYPGSGQGGHL